MSIRDVQIFNHRHYKTIRNVCIALILFIVFIVPSIVSLRTRGDLIAKIAAQADTIAAQTKVIDEQNKQIKAQGIENKELNQKAIDHVDCVARVFADYTHNFVPISIKDLDSCSITTGTSGNSSLKVLGSSSNQTGSSSNSSSTSSANGQAVSQGSSGGTSSSSSKDNTPPPPRQSFFLPGSQGLVRDSVPILGWL